MPYPVTSPRCKPAISNLPIIVDLTGDDHTDMTSRNSSILLETRVTTLERQVGIKRDRDTSLSERIGRLEDKMGISLMDRVVRLENILVSSTTVDASIIHSKDDSDDSTITRKESDEFSWKEEAETSPENFKDEILPYGINKTDDWKIVWEKLKHSGWLWKKGQGLKTFYYIKPDCKIRGGKEFTDYFTTEEDVQNYLESTYGWEGRRNIHSKT